MLFRSGWKLSPDFSLGGRANLERFDSIDPGSTNNEGERKNEFQLSARTRQRPVKGVNSELNLFTGLLDLNNVSQVKRGFSGDLNGRIRAVRGAWLSHDVFGSAAHRVRLISYSYLTGLILDVPSFWA